VTVIAFDPAEALSTALGKEAEAMFIIDGADEEPCGKRSWHYRPLIGRALHESC
jgi:hypothetical protein